MSDKIKMIIGVGLVYTLVMWGMFSLRNKHMEKVESRPNYTISQSVESIDGKMELTTVMYYYPLAKEDVMINIGKLIYTNTVEIPSAYYLETMKKFEFTKAEPFEITHKTLNEIIE